MLTSSGTDWVSQIPAVSIFDKSTTTVSVTNTTTETTLYSVTVPANTLGTNHLLRVSIGGTYLNNTGLNHSIRLKIKYGAMTLYDDTTDSLGVDANNRGWRLELILAANAATNAQKLLGRFAIGDLGAATAGTGDIGKVLADQDAMGGPLYGTSAIDSTAAQTLAVRVIHAAASTSLTISREIVITELIQ